MSKSASSRSPKTAPPAAARRWVWLGGCIALVALAIVALALVPSGGGRKRRSPAAESAVGASTTGASPVGASTTGASPAGASAEGHSADEHSTKALQQLVGRWKRVDADYVLKIKSVDAQGLIEAAYLNPSQIHVEKASAHSHGDAAHLTVELRDVNYPGCIYDLKLDPVGDKLVGTYFQAALGETYEVAFERSE